MKKIIQIIILFILISSCIQQLDWTEDENFGNTLVVEGLVTSVEGPHYVLLSLSNPVITDKVRTPVTGAIVTINTGEEIWILKEVEPGRYETDSKLSGEPGKNYQVNIQWNNKTILGEDTMIPMHEIEPLPIFNETEIPGLDGFHRFTLRNNFSTQKAYKYKLEYQKPENIKDHYPSDWVVPGWYKDALAKFGRPVIDTSYYVVPGPEPPALLSSGKADIVGIAKGTKMKETFFSMSDSHYKFIRAVLLETDWKGVSPISSKPANAPTNLMGDMPVVGFFAAADVQYNSWVVQ